jgi:D-alanyl-D-alanine carboxypeptidase
MTNSQNGWEANNRSLVSRRPIPGSTIGVTVRNGPAGDLLLEVASLFDRLVQDIDPPPLDDWGYAERPVRGSTAISNHASGTAIDLNATKWPLGSQPSKNLNLAQIATVQRIVAATGGVVRWGGNYTGRKDPMHFEINDHRTEADCVRALDQLRAAFSTGDDLFMALTDAEQHEILTAIRKGKFGVDLPARSKNCRVPHDDEYGHVMNGEAAAEDTRAAVVDLARQVAALTALVQKSIAGS